MENDIPKEKAVLVLFSNGKISISMSQRVSISKILLKKKHRDLLQQKWKKRPIDTFIIGQKKKYRSNEDDMVHI
jgi:2C-methyl-D-erythritol 2,4-cyclodiphosphate synthase